ncbi:MAG: hypothetical protein JNL83_15675 [Myxococcales bacterium]|nr:hypothetical protein [Myxococcales bacterium]
MSGVPDVRDSGGRLKRIVIALALAAGGAVIAYVVMGQVVAGDTRRAAYVSSRQMDGGTFQIYVTLAAFVVVLVVAIGVLENLAKKKYLASLENRLS